MILLIDTEDPGQTVRIRRLIWAFALACPKKRFRIKSNTS